MGIRNTIKEIKFNQQQTAPYKLSILAGVDSFFYAISSSANELLLLKDYQIDPGHAGGSVAAFNDFRHDEPLLQLPYREVKVALQSTASTLIPQRLYNATKLNEYLSAVSPVEDYQEIYRDELPTLDMTHVYAADATWKNLLTQQFNPCKIYHLNTVLLRSLQRRQRGKSGHALYANVSTQNVQLFLYDGNNLIFSNTFEYKSVKDFVYYVLLTYDQFKLSPSELALHLSGQINQDSELYRLLYRYVKTIEFISVTDLIKPGENFQSSTPLHHYYDLASLIVY